VTAQGTIESQWQRVQRAFLARVNDHGPFDTTIGTIIVLPSLTLPIDELNELIGMQFYEERLLFLLFLLSEPSARMTFISSSEITPDIVNYYLNFLPDPEAARKRLMLVSLDDSRRLPLTTKLLENQQALSRIRAGVHKESKPYLLPFTVTGQEEQLAALLGIPIYGISASSACLGSKSGGRLIAREAGVRLAHGLENVHTFADVQRGFSEIYRDDANRVLVKLDDSFSGKGNAILSRQPLKKAVAISKDLWAVLPEGVISWQEYLHRLLERGGVVEEMITSPVAAPSVQMLIKPGRAPEVVSTHDQILGGPSGHVYLGCEFPADETYRSAIIRDANKIAVKLAGKGVVGLFSIDFVVSQYQRRVYFTEINLRVGGTTHPFGIASYLTRSTYDASTGLLISPLGPRYYIASDNIQNDLLIGVAPSIVLKAMESTGLLFDASTLCGATLHQMGSLPDSGKLGICSIATSRDEARNDFRSACESLISFCD
jgi:hypothetical protein